MSSSNHGVLGLQNALVAIVLCLGLTLASVTNAAEKSKAPLAEAIFTDSRQANASLQLVLSEKLTKLVRWGHPAPVKSAEQILLTDGSLLLPSQKWSPTSKIKLDEKELKLNRDGKLITLAREDIAKIQIHPTRSHDQYDLLASPSQNEFDLTEEIVTLTDGDLLKGRIKSFDGEQFSLDLYGQSVELPSERVATLQFGRSEQSNYDPNQPKFLVGLADGSLLKASDLGISSTGYRIDLSCGLELKGPVNQIVFFQPMSQNVAYLSNLEPIDYQHTPYFSLRWPYGKDLLPVRGRLKVDGHYYAKGIAMHTASRLVYALDTNASRFQAMLAIAENSANEPSLGSATFQIFLVEQGGIRSIYESPILRTGDAPLPIDLEVAGARALVLTVDYAEGADIGDNALWLDARIVLSPNEQN